jgi:hypothetical protein
MARTRTDIGKLRDASIPLKAMASKAGAEETGSPSLASERPP